MGNSYFTTIWLIVQNGRNLIGQSLGLRLTLHRCMVSLRWWGGDILGRGSNEICGSKNWHFVWWGKDELLVLIQQKLLLLNLELSVELMDLFIWDLRIHLYGLFRCLRLRKWIQVRYRWWEQNGWRNLLWKWVSEFPELFFPMRKTAQNIEFANSYSVLSSFILTYQFTPNSDRFGSCSCCDVLRSGLSCYRSPWAGAIHAKWVTKRSKLTSLTLRSSCCPWANEQNCPSEQHWLSS